MFISPVWAYDSCLDLLGEDTEVSFMYYPAGFGILGHAKIEVDGRVFNTFGVPYEMKHVSRHERLGRRSVFSYFVKFTYRISAEDADILLKDLQSRMSGHHGFITCSAGACWALSSSNTVYVPPGVRLGPSSTAAYLLLRKIISFDSKPSITWHGSRKAKILSLVTAPTSLGIEVMVSPFPAAADLVFEVSRATKSGIIELIKAFKSDVEQ